MPGNSGSRRSSLQIRFWRSSSFTVRCATVDSKFLYLRSAPRVSGRPAGCFITNFLSAIVAICYARPIPIMALDLSEVEFRRYWQRLQTMGLNAYEARSYLVLVGHPRFKALELAARAHVPRQKIYEVLDSLV